MSRWLITVALKWELAIPVLDAPLMNQIGNSRVQPAVLLLIESAQDGFTPNPVSEVVEPG